MKERSDALTATGRHTGAACADVQLADGDTLVFGDEVIRVIATPGHTPGCISYRWRNCVFTGDALLIGGCGRTDFQGGDAGTLYDSIQRVLALPHETRLFMCHDYGPNGRDIRWETTVGEQQDHNIHVGKRRTREEFIAMREARDATLKMPTLIIPSLQVNMKAGELPPEDESGKRFLKVPLGAL